MGPGNVSKVKVIRVKVTHPRLLMGHVSNNRVKPLVPWRRQLNTTFMPHSVLKQILEVECNSNCFHINTYIYKFYCPRSIQKVNEYTEINFKIWSLKWLINVQPCSETLLNWTKQPHKENQSSGRPENVIVEKQLLMSIIYETFLTH